MNTEFDKNKDVKSITSRIVLPILTAFAIVIFYQLAGGLLSILFEGYSPMVLQIVAQTVFFLVPISIAIKASGSGVFRVIGLGRANPKESAFLAFVGIALCIVVVQGQINLQDALVPESMMKEYNSIKEFFDGEYSQLFGAPSIANIALAAVGACAIPAISEELLFRGYLLNSLSGRFSLRTSVVVSALAFSAVHFHPVNFVALFAIGVLLAVLAIRTGNLLAPMIAHFLNNAFSVAAYFMDYPGQAADDSSIVWYISLPMMVCGATLLILFLKWGWKSDSPAFE